jgi:hypothetical protein
MSEEQKEEHARAPAEERDAPPPASTEPRRRALPRGAANTGPRSGWIVLAVIAAAFALLWAVHPMRAESVAWIASRKDLVFLLFGFIENRLGRFEFFLNLHDLNEDESDGKDKANAEHDPADESVIEVGCAKKNACNGGNK